MAKRNRGTKSGPDPIMARGPTLTAPDSIPIETIWPPAKTKFVWHWKVKIPPTIEVTTHCDVSNPRWTVPVVSYTSYLNVDWSATLNPGSPRSTSVSVAWSYGSIALNVVSRGTLGEADAHAIPI